LRIEEATFVVTDTETTGSRAGEDRLIEIGAVKVRGGEVVGTFQHLVNPARHVPRRIALLTGISTATVFDQPTAAEVLPLWREFLGDGILVAHNLPFDLRFLEVELDLAGQPPLRNETLCTLRLARRLLSALPSKGLSGLAEHFGIAVQNRHRALGDAEATAKLLLILVERLRTEFGVETAAELLAFQRKRYRETRREPAHLARIREEVLVHLPDRPGVYSMRDRRGRVIYVGKAKSLRSRVRSYFVGVDNHPPKTKKLVRDARDVTWTETGTELAALLEESKAIKQLLPVYNRAQRKYRDYPFLRLDTTHAYPTLTWTPRLETDGAEYYGPLGRRGQAEELVELVNRLFRLRECEDPVFDLGRPCIYAQMGRCVAPCVGGEGAAVYPVLVERVRAFLRGQDEDALTTVEEAMHAAAARLEFESAGWYRDQLRRLRRTLGRQKQVASPVHDHHAVLVEPLAPGYGGREDGGAQLFFLRYGRLVGRLDLPAGPDPAAEALLRAALEAPFDPAAPPPDRFERADVDEIRILAHWMRLHPGRHRQVRWAPGTDADGFVEAVLAAARAAKLAPEDEPVEEEEL
jgi:DNA polymerase-3 subunit epsilon